MSTGEPDAGGQVDLSPWVRAAVDGDEEAFGVLYNALQPGLLRYLKALVGQDAEDVASEAWLQIARDLRGYRGEGGGFRAWAVSVARHRAMDHLRRQSRRPARLVEAELLDQIADGHDTAGRAVEALATDAAIALIATLPRDQAEAVLLRAVVGLDAHSAAEVLGKRPGAVRTAAYRGLRRLARRLDQDSVPGPTAPRPASSKPATPAAPSGTPRPAVPR